MGKRRQYSDEMLAGMQAAYGKGFLSPGAAADMRRLMAPVDAAGKCVLDLGCGVGGATVMLAGEFAAGSVISADLEPEALRQTRERINAAGLEGIATTVQIEPGVLPFPAASFDIVYSKDVICHIENKVKLFMDLRRLLRPGGVVVLGDWMAGNAPEGADAFQSWERHLNAGGLEFYFESGSAYARAFREAGFAQVEVDDESPAFLAGAERELAKLMNVDELGVELGEEAASRRIGLTQARLDALRPGGLAYCHIRARV